VSEEHDSAVGRWLQRPYVAHRQTQAGPKMTNFAALVSGVLIQTLTLLLVETTALPFAVAPLPATAMIAITALMWLEEPPERRRAYDD